MRPSSRLLLEQCDDCFCLSSRVQDLHLFDGVPDLQSGLLPATRQHMRQFLSQPLLLQLQQQHLQPLLHQLLPLLRTDRVLGLRLLLLPVPHPSQHHHRTVRSGSRLSLRHLRKQLHQYLRQVPLRLLHLQQRVGLLHLQRNWPPPLPRPEHLQMRSS